MENFLSITIAVAAGAWVVLLVTAFFGKLLGTALDHILHHRKDWKRNAVEAEAMILHVEKTGLYINNRPQLRLQMQVKPVKGRNFVAEISDVEDNRLSALKTGSVVKVKYNPKNFRELFLVPAVC